MVLDGIGPRMLKPVSAVLSQSITALINICRSGKNTISESTLGSSLSER